MELLNHLGVAILVLHNKRLRIETEAGGGVVWLLFVFTTIDL